jgi:hypothetical protein
VFSQTIKSYIKNQWQDSRYINHKDGTVTDTITGLMWKQCAEGFSLSESNCTINTPIKYAYTWKEAIERADASENKPFAKYSDWRLPNIKELRSLVAFDRYNPAINSTLFPDSPTLGFWSSSPYASNAYDAWILDFGDGEDDFYDRSSYYFVRLVRGGQ